MRSTIRARTRVAWFLTDCHYWSCQSRHITWPSESEFWSFLNFLVTSMCLVEKRRPTHYVQNTKTGVRVRIDFRWWSAEGGQERERTTNWRLKVFKRKPFGRHKESGLDGQLVVYVQWTTPGSFVNEPNVGWKTVDEKTEMTQTMSIEKCKRFERLCDQKKNKKNTSNRLESQTLTRLSREDFQCITERDGRRE